MKIRLGKSKVTFRKSDRLVGLKTLKSRSTNKSVLPESVKEEQRKFDRLGGFEIFDIGEEKNADSELDAIREAPEVEIGTHVYLVGENDVPFVPNGYIYITFADGLDKKGQAMVLDEFKLELGEQTATNKVEAIVTADSMNPIKVAYRLEESSLVETAYADVGTVLEEFEVPVPSNPLFPLQWHLKSTKSFEGLNGPQAINPKAHLSVFDAWNRLGNKGSSNITIAIIDRGFDINHPDLKDNIVHSHDVWEDKPFDIDSESNKRSDHGTPCAGLALARDNGSGTIGVAPNSKFMPLSGTSFYIKDTKVMYNHCLKHNADIISCSWGSVKPEHEYTPEHEDIIKNAATKGRDGKGCIIVCAAGNKKGNVINVIARHPDVICVGASTSEDFHSHESNRGFEVDVVAPSNGGNWPLVAPKASWDDAEWFENTKEKKHKLIKGPYKDFGGTSAATPLVAGVCALILSANPNLTAKEVKEILIQTADKIGHPSNYVNGHSRRYGYGRVNADKAVAEAQRRLDFAGQIEIEEQVGSGRGFFRFNATPQPTFGFGVQIGAFYEYGNVLIQVGKLQDIFKDLPIMVNINELEGRTVYKVSIGQFTEQKEARELLEKIREKGFDGTTSDYRKLA